MESVEVEKNVLRNSNQNKPREQNGKASTVVFKWKNRYKQPMRAENVPLSTVLLRAYGSD